LQERYWVSLHVKGGKVSAFRRSVPGNSEPAKDDKIKAALMHMAQVWLRLAANQTKEIERDEAD